MSLYTENENLFPNLPGYRTKTRPTGLKKTSLRLVDGLQIISEDFLPRLTKNRDLYDIENKNATSLVSTTSSLLSRPKVRVNAANVGVVLNFKAFFEEDVSYSTKNQENTRIRVCNIIYFAENGCISVVEKPQLNSGIPQGTLVRKDIIMKDSTTPLGPIDLLPGNQVVIFKRVYNIVDCDEFTKAYLVQEYRIDNIPSYELPIDSHSLYRSNIDHGPSDDWNKYRSKKNQNKAFNEAKLGNSVDNSGREGFIRYGSQKLKFACVWDNSAKLYGDITEYTLIYHMSDDTVEISATNSQANTGKDSFTRLLKRSKLPKHALVSSSNNIGGININDCYTWRDLDVGMELNVYGRVLKIYDADQTTREFYYSNGRELDYNEKPTSEAIVNHSERIIPPPTGFGSEEDSLRSCMGSLQIQPPHFKKLGENKVLSFTATLSSGGPDDIDRKFVLMYYVMDGTLKILEPPVRNSGFVGGTFLSRRAHKLSNGETLNESHMYIGAKVSVMNNVFLLHETNDSTLRWMEEHHLPKADKETILYKIRPYLYNDAQCGRLEEVFRMYDAKNEGVSMEVLRTVLKSYGLIQGEFSNNELDEDHQLIAHELLTIFRMEGNRSKVFDYKMLIDMILYKNMVE